MDQSHRARWRAPAPMAGQLMRRTPLPVATGLLLCSLLLASCGRGGGQGAFLAKGTSTSWTPYVCKRAAPSPVQADPVPGIASDWTITSFDGTKIRAHWFPATGTTTRHPDPTVLMGPGWGMSGQTKSTSGLLGGAPINNFNDAGYNVLTWDPRGFGQSTGTIEVDSPNYEGRDVSRLIDWVATQPGVELDALGDPRMGMVGGSYGGGIQFTTAAEDCRVDAIVPAIAWHSLATSLDKANTAKTGWSDLLYVAAPKSHLDAHITHAYDDGNTTGLISAADRQWFVDRGPGNLVKRVKVPTLILQGTVDTLFTLDEAVANYQILKANGVPVHMVWFCGGHGICLTNQGNPTFVQRLTLSWLDRWVKRNRSVNTGARVDIIDQQGSRYAANDYPIPSTRSISANGSGTLQLVGSGGAGPVVLPAGNTDPLGPFADKITPARATNTVNVTIQPPAHPSLVVGAPEVTVTYHGTVAPGKTPARVFTQLVDNSSGLVLGNQITPVDVTLDGHSHTTTVPLEVVVQAMTPGHPLTLQLVATTVAYAKPRLGGTVSFERVHVSLPVARHIVPNG
jgi:ABC-2 type transport system ATP-binding protein